MKVLYFLKLLKLRKIMWSYFIDFRPIYQVTALLLIQPVRYKILKKTELFVDKLRRLQISVFEVYYIFLRFSYTLSLVEKYSHVFFVKIKKVVICPQKPYFFQKNYFFHRSLKISSCIEFYMSKT